MPEDMRSRMPENILDKMPENMPDKMPEGLPVTKRINVMVEMTRSKLIFIVSFVFVDFSFSSFVLF